METAKTLEIEIPAMMQKKQLSRPRLMFLAVVVITVSYVAWGIAKVLF